MTGADAVDADVLVAGGGPVGLACAIEAALAGLSVVVLEPRAGVLDKACGEGLMPGAVTALRRLGVDPPGVDLCGIAYVDGHVGGRSVEHRFRTGPGRGVRRTALHAALSRRAADLGVAVLGRRVADVRQDATGVQAAGLRGRWLLAADGIGSPVRRSLGLDRPVSARRRYGLRQHFALAPWTDLVEVHWSPVAEAYVTPVAADLVGVAVLGPGGAGFDTWLAHFPRLSSRLAGAAAAGPVLGAGPLRRAAARVVDGRVLLVGDASGYVDALTGEGIRVGLGQAQAAVACVAGDDPTGYARRWRHTTREVRWLTSALVTTTGPATVRRHLVQAVERLPRVYGLLVERLAS